MIQVLLHQKSPDKLLHSTFVTPDNFDNPRETLAARSELERRGEYIEILEHQVGTGYPALVQLVKECLHNAPAKRPTTDDVLDRLQRMREQIKGKYGSCLVKIDFSTLRLAKEMEMKDDTIARMREEQVRQILSKIDRHNALVSLINRIGTKLDWKGTEFNWKK